MKIVPDWRLTLRTRQAWLLEGGSIGGSLKRKTRILLTITLTSAALAYIAVALSPLPRQIARNSPEKASVFRPLTFNFAAVYADGSVLGLAIGSTRDELFGAFQAQYAASGLLQAACGREVGAPPLTAAQSSVAIGAAGARELLNREVACLWLPARKIMLIFRFAGDRLHIVELSYVRSELNF